MQTLNIAPQYFKKTFDHIQQDESLARSEGLRVICAGLPRTGTLSLKAALTSLLGGRCYHGFDTLFGSQSDVDFWVSVSKVVWCVIVRTKYHNYCLHGPRTRPPTTRSASSSAPAAARRLRTSPRLSTTRGCCRCSPGLAWCSPPGEMACRWRLIVNNCKYYREI